jgi:hypothetical protein
MKFSIVGVMALAGCALAHPATAQLVEPGNGYVAVVVQAAMGDVTSRHLGGEVGYTITPRVQVIGEVGRSGDLTTAARMAAAQTIAVSLVDAQPAPVSFTVVQPVTFGAAGVKYLVPVGGALIQPYILGELGIAKATSTAHFYAGGTDVTSSLQQYLIQLGTDVQGSITSAVVQVGAGATLPLGPRLFLDGQARYGHMMSVSIDMLRVGVGVGVKF